MFRLAYQPIMDLEKEKVVAYEALLRPDNGSAPLEMLDRYRKAGMVHELDLSILTVALAEGEELLSDSQLLMVNLEPETLLRDELWSDWKFPVEPERVVFEITERSASHAIDQKRFKDLGVGLALDDFGTGFSNLLSLQQLKPSFVKMSRDFLEPHSHTGIIAGMAQYLRHTDVPDIKLIVEGIEDEEDVCFLRELDIRYGQGFYLGLPEFLEQHQQRRANDYVVTRRH